MIFKGGFPVIAKKLRDNSELFNGISTLIFSPQLKFKESFCGMDYIDASEVLNSNNLGSLFGEV